MAKKPKHIEQRIKSGRYYVPLDKFKELVKANELTEQDKRSMDRQNVNIPTN